jgi:rhodanese-related sulfurtransferase
MTYPRPSAIDGAALADLIDSGADLALVEALPVASYDDAHLPGAQDLPHDSDDATIADVLPDRARTVVVYCSNLACQNSTILSRRLAQLGYTDVREYEAGKQDWIEAGRPVVSNVTS